MLKHYKMTPELQEDAFKLLRNFLRDDEYYLDSSKVYGDGGDEALIKALNLFLTQPQLGFIWITYTDDQPVGICIVCFAISTSLGAVVAKLDDVFVVSERQGEGIGSAMLTALKQELRRSEVGRIDTSVHFQNHQARKFYEKQGFCSLNEEKLSYLL